MSRSERLDPHRPGAILPSDYRHVLTYYRSKDGRPGFRFDCVRDKAVFEFSADGVAKIVANGRHEGDPTCCVVALRESGAPFFERGSSCNCSVCGAWYSDGDVWIHEPTAELVFLGHTCADKYGMSADREEWLEWHRRRKALLRQAAKDKRFKVAALRFLEARPALAEDFKATSTDARDSRALAILADLLSKLNKYGSLSDAQVALAAKLAAQVREVKPAVVVERHVDAPTGRVNVRGKVVSTRSQEGDFGVQYKMVVKVETPEGSWLCWSTVPSAMFDLLAKDLEGRPNVDGYLQALKGREVSFTATLSPGKDPWFAFAKRPTGAELVGKEESR